MKALIHYAEIALKKKNRSYFENILINNIKNTLKSNLKKVEKDHKRIILTLKKEDNKLNNIFGIKNYSYIKEINPNTAEIIKESLKLIKKEKEISIQIKRSDKSFPLTSIELSKKIGTQLTKKKKKINFSNPEITIYIEITRNKTYLYTKKIKSLGGLPVSSTGKVLCLFSGGIDSAVAPYLAMKRGCKVDYLHIHTSKNNNLSKTKIPKIIKKLNKYQLNSKLILIPYHNFQLGTIGKIDQNLDLVIFKNFILKLAESFNYQAILTGDNLAQVASQTLENLSSTQFNVKKLILSPLLTYDKEEIINLAKEIDTFNLAIEEYKDCCSIISKKPLTKVSITKLEKTLTKINMEEIIKKSIKESETISI